MKLIIGLGNPGDKYTNTRHNIGFRILDQLQKDLEAEPAWSAKYDALVSEAEVYGEKVLLIKPQTFMNLSGKAVQQFVNFYKLSAEKDILIIFDDKDLIFSKTRERSEGSAGGHNGIKSLIKELGTEQFFRLKVGIGHEEQLIPTDAFVLQKFSAEEEQELPKLIKDCSQKAQYWLHQEF